MGLRPSKVRSSVLDPVERRRLVVLEPFRSAPVDLDIDRHLLALGLIRLIKSAGRVTLTPAGRVARRLIQELIECSVSKL